MAGELPLTNWKSEYIRNRSFFFKLYLLYRRINTQYIKTKDPARKSPSSFKNNGEGMSADWSKYAIPHDSQKRDVNNPEDYGVVNLAVRDIRKRDKTIKLTIKHTPDPKTKTYEGNQAHTDVIGILDYGAIRRRTPNKAQVFLARIAEWEINEKLEALENFLKEELMSNWKRIRKIWKSYKAGEIDKEEFNEKVLRKLGRKNLF